MCMNCDNPLPEEAAKFMSMGLATVADEMERQNDMQIRLACLKYAIQVKGAQGDSQVVLKSAHAYYDFVTNKDKDVSIK